VDPRSFARQQRKEHLVYATPVGLRHLECSAAQNIARPSIECRERQQPSPLRERRQLTKVAEERLAVERRQIPRLAKLRVRERRQDRIDVVDRGKRMTRSPTRSPSGGTDRPNIGSAARVELLTVSSTVPSYRVAAVSAPTSTGPDRAATSGK
jgi:hypothetical protein